MVFQRVPGEAASRVHHSQANRFVLEQRIDPCMSDVFTWDKIPLAHMRMWKNEHPPGNMAVMVNAPRAGLKTFEDAQEAGR